MNIVVGSAFRNAAHYVPRYLSQVAALRDLLAGKHNVRVIAVEGDSCDGTAHALERIASTFGLGIEVRSHHHGKGWFGSTEQPERMATLSGVGNTILDGVSPQDDILVYVESDLLWDPFTIATLIECAAARWRDYDIVSPLIFAGECFYDVWGFRGEDDQRFSPFKPYHSSLAGREFFWTTVHSVGSCLVMKGDVARNRNCRMTDGALVQFCARARGAGYNIGVNPTLKVHHP